MTEKSERLQSLREIDGRLEGAIMTSSERQEAKHALQLGARIGDFLFAATIGLKRLVQGSRTRRAPRATHAAS